MQKELKTPICLDESITSAAKARKAIQIGACGWINIKPGRVGGLTVAKDIHDTCQDAGIPCWVGGMLESSLGGHQCLALATLDNFNYPADVFPSSRFYEQDLSVPAMALTGPSEAFQCHTCSQVSVFQTRTSPHSPAHATNLLSGEKATAFSGRRSSSMALTSLPLPLSQTRRKPSLSPVTTVWLSPETARL